MQHYGNLWIQSIKWMIVIESVTPKLGKLMVSYNFTGSVTAPDLSDYNLMNASEKIANKVLAGLYNWGDANSYDS